MKFKSSRRKQTVAFPGTSGGAPILPYARWGLIVTFATSPWYMVSNTSVQPLISSSLPKVKW